MPIDCVFKGCFGDADDGTLYRIASMTKPITAAAVLKAFEERNISLDTKITEFLPDFKNPIIGEKRGDKIVPAGKADSIPTVRSLLSHSSGIGCGEIGWMQTDNFPFGKFTSLKDLVDAESHILLRFEPFSDAYYSPIASFDIAARIIEIVTGEEFGKWLNDDYTDFTDEMSIHIPKQFPPFTRETPAFFKRGGRKFLLTSGTTGYFPNETVLYEITDFHGEWRELGKPCVNDVNKNSFACQFSSVFRHPFIKDLYIASGDRWLRDLPANMPDINAIYERMFDKTKDPLPDGFTTTALSDENTSEATYVWLPVRFSDDGTPYICWETEWRVNPTGESGEKD